MYMSLNASRQPHSNGMRLLLNSAACRAGVQGLLPILLRPIGEGKHIEVMMEAMIRNTITTTQKRLCTFCYRASVWPAGQRGWSIIALHCALDDGSLVSEAKASEDNNQDTGMFQT